MSIPLRIGVVRTRMIDACSRAFTTSVESVRLDPELKRDRLLRAAEEHISVSEAVRRAIGQYVRAS